MSTPVLKRIREKLDRLRGLDDGRLDITDHGYREGQPLTEAEVVAVEQDYEITFPSDFRDFLQSVHSGGAGPHYGLIPITEEAPIVAAPSVEFPLTAEDARIGGIDHMRATDEDGDLVGVWPLADVGCGITEVLVITGAQRGFVWTIGDGVWNAHLDPQGKQITFAGWYEAWLDNGLATLGESLADAPARSCYVLELASDSASDSPNEANRPTAKAPQFAPMRVVAIAMP